MHHITGPESSWIDFAQLPLIVLITPQLLPIAPVYFGLHSHKVGRMGRKSSWLLPIVTLFKQPKFATFVLLHSCNDSFTSETR